MRGGSMSDQGRMSDQRGGNMGSGSMSNDKNRGGNMSSSDESGSDDYQRNDIGNSTTGSTGSDRSSDR
jgi:hypothetical protein